MSLTDDGGLRTNINFTMLTKLFLHWTALGCLKTLSHLNSRIEIMFEVFKCTLYLCTSHHQNSAKKKRKQIAL